MIEDIIENLSLVQCQKLKKALGQRIAVLKPLDRQNIIRQMVAEHGAYASCTYHEPIDGLQNYELSLYCRASSRNTESHMPCKLDKIDYTSEENRWLSYLHHESVEDRRKDLTLEPSNEWIADYLGGPEYGEVGIKFTVYYVNRPLPPEGLPFWEVDESAQISTNVNINGKSHELNEQTFDLAFRNGFFHMASSDSETGAREIHEMGLDKLLVGNSDWIPLAPVIAGKRPPVSHTSPWAKKQRYGLWNPEGMNNLSLVIFSPFPIGPPVPSPMRDLFTEAVDITTSYVFMTTEDWSTIENLYRLK